MAIDAEGWARDSQGLIEASAHFASFNAKVDALMLRYATTVFSLSLLLILIAGAPAILGEDQLKSGPQPGEFIPGPFHFLNVNGAHASSPHCLVCEFGLKPVVAVFVREVPTDLDKSKALFDLLTKLDDAVAAHQKAELCAFAVFLSKEYTDEATRKPLVKRLEDVATKFKQLVVSVGGAEGPDKYNLSNAAEVTVLLYSRSKVVANFAYGKDKLTDKDAETVLAAVEKMVPKK
jgi:hypothetical protein